MHLLTDLPWQAWILSTVLVVVWIALWFVRGGSRLRMWFAGLSPVASLVGLVIGVVALPAEGGSSSGALCSGPEPCGAAEPGPHWATAFASTPDYGFLIIANAAIALVVAFALLVIIAAIDLPRMAAAREMAESAKSQGVEPMIR